MQTEQISASPAPGATARLKSAFEWMLRRVFHSYWQFQRGMTLGVRGMIIDASGRVFLVKHSYVRGWHLPGGGVEVGETIFDALERELAEEANVELTDQPSLYGMYLHGRVSLRDHIVLFVIRGFRQASAPQPNREIVDHGFFSPDALPDETTRGTRQRIAEVLHGAAVSPHW
jgi:8-oxo-dGTP pyrophosphatase MutT (NUDIX family)